MTDASTLPGAFHQHGDWQLHAACRDFDSSLFFHPSNERGDAWAEREKEAKRICGRCPVRSACLRYALDAREQFGVWGGLGEKERRAILGLAGDDRGQSRAVA